MARKRKAKEAGQVSGPSEDNSLRITPILSGYLQEARNARNGGLNPRDLVWESNLHAYWARTDFSRKAAWQAKETIPMVATAVDRFSAALKEALVASPNGFYTVQDPADAEGDLTDAVKRMTDVWLSQCGRNQTGTALGFPAVFEEQVKQGALMAMSSVVTWKRDLGQGRVCIETADPRNVWLDPTYRNLYRIRRIELDKHDLVDMAKARDGAGAPIYNLAAIDQMISHIALESEQQKEQATGHGHQQTSTRRPVTMDEYIGTVVDTDGKVIARDALMVVGNEQFLIRGPEPNPFWHKRDWLVYTPLILTPFSVYGRSYVEDFAGLAKTFNNFTNLILDAVQTSAMKAYAVVPSLLLNPEQLSEGVTPNKTFYLEDGADPKGFINAVDLGHIGPEAFQVWQALKTEVREASDINEVGLGQFAPKGRTSATEVSQTQESSSALIRSIAQTIEGRWLNPTLDLVWKTGLQHVSATDPVIRDACGEELFTALLQRRRELIARPITFQAQGISALIQKNKMLRSLLQLFQILSQSDPLLQSFLQVVDMGRLVKLLFHLSDIDMSKVTPTQREQVMQQVAGQLQAAGQQAQPNPQSNPTEARMGAELPGMMQQLGIARAA